MSTMHSHSFLFSVCIDWWTMKDIIGFYVWRELGCTDMKGKLHLSSFDMCVYTWIISVTINTLCVHRNVPGKLRSKCLQLFPFFHCLCCWYVNWEILGKKENLAVRIYSGQKGQKRKKMFNLPSIITSQGKNQEFLFPWSNVFLSMKGFMGSIWPK